MIELVVCVRAKTTLSVGKWVYFGYYDTASFLRSSPLVGRTWGVEDVRAGKDSVKRRASVETTTLGSRWR